jgi:hypothetical protein
MKKLLCISLLGLLLSCNETGNTSSPANQDNTNVKDSTSALTGHDTFNQPKDTMAPDSLKNIPNRK